jgi:1,4-alpha-glucan branching enzyme
MILEKSVVEYLDNYHIGKCYNSYEYFGAHMIHAKERKGVRFTLWAPNALAVSVVGSFNEWDDNIHQMERLNDNGIWHLFIPSIKEGEQYKYKLILPDGRHIYKADPYAFHSEVRPGTSSIIVDLNQYNWNDSSFLQTRQAYNPLTSPINIYEIHLGSWNVKENSTLEDDIYKSLHPKFFYSYREIADQLIPYLKEMHYNFIEILPLMEHPFDGSWGYQVTGYYSMTSRYGTPQDLMYLIDTCHQANIGVIFDWVPGHFCRDEHGLLYFDGTPLYDGIDHPNWGTKKFNFYRSEVRNFLISNASFYFEKYHIDGIRVDGVTSILQMNFGLDNETYVNEYGNGEDLHGVAFLKELNTEVFKKYPYAIMAAEESSSWPLVTAPVEDSGLGFNLKWKMGWMNDTLQYISMDPLFRKGSHDLITFSMHYANSENFLLPFSHDEVVHGKKSMIDKCPGSYEDKFLTLKLTMLYQITHPGKKLNFMGNEIAQFIEWRYYEPIEWFLLEYDAHQRFHHFIKTINKLYLQEKALYEKDYCDEGFQWIDADNCSQSIFSYIRYYNKEDFIIVILNFTPVGYDEFRIGVPYEGEYRILLETKHEPFRKTKIKYVKTEEVPMHNFEQSITISLDGLQGVLIKKKRTKKS